MRTVYQLHTAEKNDIEELVNMAEKSGCTRPDIEHLWETVKETEDPSEIISELMYSIDSDREYGSKDEEAIRCRIITYNDDNKAESIRTIYTSEILESVGYSVDSEE